MDYFRKIDSNEWNLTDIYTSYAEAYPSKKRDQIILSLKKDIQLFQKDNSTQSAATRLLDSFKAHEFPKSNIEALGTEPAATSTPISSVGKINISNMEGDISQQFTFNSNGKRSNNLLSDDEFSKKSKSVHSKDGIGSLTNELKSYPSTLWDVWESFLYHASCKEDMFCYSPEKYGIITCGDGISKRELMPENAYNELNQMKPRKSENIIKYFQEYLSAALDAASPEEMEGSVRSTPQYNTDTKDLAFFLQDMLLVFARNVYKESPELSHSESLYNGVIVHPVIYTTTLALSGNAVKFIHGEEQLQAVTKQLKKINDHFDERHSYKADGIIRYQIEKYNAEIFILETSNGYDEASNTKRGFDHHKATFGLLAMLKVIADEWSMGSFVSFSNIKLFFLHVFGTKMRLWSLCSPKEGVYVMKREWSVVVPIEFERRERELLDFVNSFWDLRVNLKKTMTNIRVLKKEHEEQMKEYRFKDYTTHENLLSNIVKPQIIKLSEGKNSAGMFDELPVSFINSSIVS